MIAEESTAWPMVTKPGYDGGLGFNFKVEHGLDERHAVLLLGGPVLPQGHARQDHLLVHVRLFETTFCRSRTMRSCRQVSLISKMPPPYENPVRRSARCTRLPWRTRARRCCSWAASLHNSPEWAYQRGLDWMLLDYPAHRQMQAYVKALNHFYLATPQLWGRIPTGAALSGSAMRTTTTTSSPSAVCEGRLGYRGRCQLLPEAAGIPSAFRSPALMKRYSPRTRPGSAAAAWQTASSRPKTSPCTVRNSPLF